MATYRKILPEYDNFRICRFESLAQTFPPHYHHHWLIGCLLKGKRMFHVEQKTFLGEPGQVVIIPPRKFHACESIVAESSGWLCLELPPSAIKRFYPGDYLSSRQTLILKDSAQTIIDICDKIAASDNWEKPLASFLERIAWLTTCEDKPEKPGNDRISHVLKRLQNEPDLNICLEDMAAWANMAKYSFAHAFKVATGHTPHRYLENERLARASILLEKGLTPAEAALATGYYDQAHFSKKFKAALGMTPGFCARGWREAAKNRP